ncbi:MAG TPA: hypothetical protein VGK67_39615 [Myxococcales bacterium]|jgi:hypothetical protein
MADPAPRTISDSELEVSSVEPPPRRKRPLLLFDDRDYELVDLVNEFRTVGKHKKPEVLRRLFNPALHPRGFKELAATQERRIAYAIIRLLESLEQGSAQDRILALRALHDEVFFGTQASMQNNTARVLLTVMKELAREERDYWRQVELAHDFFAAVTGRPVEIRRQLRKYHLIEMSEAWNQVAFDHHVHDAHTKGRKAPTHLVMDAWIKGIRELTVVYYYYWTADAVSELTEAAAIMGVTVRPGLEFAARCHGKFAQFIWIPQGLENPADFAAFMNKPAVKEFLDKGREVARLQSRYVLALLRAFNQKHLEQLNQRYGLNLPPLVEDEFVASIGVGQPSVTHLADFIHQKCLQRAKPLVAEWTGRYQDAGEAEKAELREKVARIDHLLPSVIAETWLQRSVNPEIPHPSEPREGDEVPELLRLKPRELCEMLGAVRSGSTLVLNLTGLTPADVLEVLYQGRGLVTHLELFNLKDYRLKKAPHTREIAGIRQTLNRGNAIVLKRVVREAIREVEAANGPLKEERLAGLREVLSHLLDFANFYSRVPLRTSLGSDSVGRAQSLFGMGLVVADTLPGRARREFFRHPGTREVLPVRTDAELHTVWTPHESPLWPLDFALRVLRKLPGLREFGYARKEAWEVVPNSTRYVEAKEGRGNILTLGGVEEHASNELSLEPPEEKPPAFKITRLNTRVRDLGKVALGFLPAFLTFYLTKDWRVLAWFGAPIWFGITGLRNILQAIIGGGGLVRSKLLTWKDLISWERVADSLLYTGFSVPLLDFLVKHEFLERISITTATAPILLYSVMALANGIYLFSHNTFRGLPRAAAFGNFFRSVLAIPIALALNALLRAIITSAGMSGVDADHMLQNWAAVISKASSDLVAGFIEGTADRNVNVRTRLRDYRTKLHWLLANHGRLEAVYPEQDILKMLESPKEFVKAVAEDQRELETRQIVNALDLMYFWMLQPRARPVFTKLMEAATPEERQIVLRTQRLLERQRLVSQMMLDGLVGKNFSPALAFYLDKSPVYLRDMKRLLEELEAEQKAS